MIYPLVAIKEAGEVKVRGKAAKPKNDPDFIPNKVRGKAAKPKGDPEFIPDKVRKKLQRFDQTTNKIRKLSRNAASWDVKSSPWEGDIQSLIDFGEATMPGEYIILGVWERDGSRIEEYIDSNGDTQPAPYNVALLKQCQRERRDENNKVLPDLTDINEILPTIHKFLGQGDRMAVKRIKKEL